MNSFDLFGNPTSRRTVSANRDEERASYVEAVSEMEEQVEEEVEPKRSFFGMGLVLGIVIILLAAQCFHLQIKNAALNQALAEGNSVRIITIQADRGLIVDSNGQTLAHNTRQLALAINPQTLPAKKADRQTVYQLLKDKAGISQQDLDFVEQNRTKSPELIPLKTDLSKEESLLYKEWFTDVPGVQLVEVPVRQYAVLPSMGQLLGYVGAPSQDEVNAGHAPNDRVGKAGLEKQYDSKLAGIPGKQKAEVDAQQEVVGSPVPLSDTKAGDTLKLSIDSHLQQIVAGALTDELARRTQKFGNTPQFGATAVVVKPSTGEILAMVSLPDYDPNLFAQGITQQQYKQLLDNPGNPLLNRATQGQFPPGSTVKPLIASAALQTGVITPDTKILTPPAITIGSFRFPDWKWHQGLSDVKRAIAESNDVFFYAVGGGFSDEHITGLGIDRMNQYLSQFGLGSPLGIDIGGEESGLLGNDAYKEKQFKESWYIGDTYHSSIGQGFTLTTPLQMAIATAAIANGGTVWQPHLAHSIIDSVTGQETVLPNTALHQNFINPDFVNVVRDGMRQTVLSGSARPLNTLKVTSAGKTGTAEFGTQGQTHAWYTGFAPYDNPQIAFAILIEGGGESFYSSVPVAEEILRGYFNEPLAPGQPLSSSTNDPAEFQGER